MQLYSNTVRCLQHASDRRVPCSRIALVLTAALLPVPGHLDGTLCLWDVRQLRSGSLKPLAEVRDHEGCVMSLAQGAADGLLLSCCRDNVVRLWDMRQLGTARRFRHASFTAGGGGEMGGGTCVCHCMFCNGAWPLRSTEACRNLCIAAVSWYPATAATHRTCRHC